MRETAGLTGDDLQLASPDTLGVNAGAYLAVVVVAVVLWLYARLQRRTSRWLA